MKENTKELTSHLTRTLKWHAGPWNGGGGTAGLVDGEDWWHDGSLILAIVETSSGRDVFMASVVCGDEDEGADLLDPLTRDYISAWAISNIAWWAEIDCAALPPKSIINALTRP